MQRIVAACMELFNVRVSIRRARLDKEVLILVALHRRIRSLLREWKDRFLLTKTKVARSLPVRALCIGLGLCLSLMGTCHLPAEIFRLPVSAMDRQLSFHQRAEAMRIPAEILANDSVLPEGGLPLAQLPDRPAWVTEPGTAAVLPAAGPQIRIRVRGGGEGNLRMFPRGTERVWIINTPTQITILDQSGPVEISADQIVVWTDQNVMSLGNVGASLAPVEFYMEGNIEFRQGGTRGIAERMYYNAAEQNGVILEGELFGEARQQTPGDAEDFRTPYRLKADVLRQFAPNQFQANNAAFTTSRLGVPGYWIESDTLSLDTGMTSLSDQLGRWSGGPDGIDQPMQFDKLQVVSENSQLFVGGWPIFRWPTFTTDLARNPSLYLDRIRLGSDSVFGQQVLTRWNNFQLLGITPQQNSDWTTTADYLSDRGFGFGTDFEYQRDRFWGRPANVGGFFHSWFINDKGLDNLGEDRRAVPLEEEFRGRVYGRHRHLTPAGLQITAELGWLSDRNFLEQYYEQEWDLEKDQETRLELKQYSGSSSLSVAGNFRLNDFFTQTEWLPQAKHFQMGRSFLGDRMTWYEHSQIGYARLRTAEAPTNPIDLPKFDLLAWERESEGLRAVSRQEFDLPLQLGVVKVVPYFLGEVGYWQEDLSGNDLTRVLGQAGVRGSVPFWRADPTVENELFNLHGLAHKLVLESEYLWADASRDYLTLPLYDALDDDSIEFFRRRFLFDTFMLGVGSDVPLKYDERVFAFRSGMQRYVAAPSSEIADDLMMLQLRLRQRIQTKRGLPGRERIVDWFTFDAEGTFYPRADRDNFGQEVGPATYDMRWHIGDRTTLLSDGYLDFFGEGLRTVSLGAALSRPGRSQYYLGIRSIEGPISSNVLTSAVTYRLSPKWILNYGSSVDFSSTGNIGQSGKIIRVGESALIALGGYYDASRDNFGLRFDIAPRFIRSKLGMIGGRPIPPVGAYGLE